MSAPESTMAAVPVAEVVSTDVPPVVEVVESKAEEPPIVVPETVTAPVDTKVVTDDPAKEVKPGGENEGEGKKDGAPKSPSFLAKLLSGFKQEKKSKPPKSPKKEKKKEEVEAPATVEAPKEVPAPEVPEVVETVTEAEPVVTEAAAAPAEVVAVVTEEAKEKTPAAQGGVKALKVGRRFSARVGDYFKSKPKAEVATPAKVDEHPPKIDEPVPVAPLENPATDTPKVEEPKLEAAAPVVAATA